MADEINFTKSYKIPSDNLFQLNRRLSAIAARAKKLGFPEITWNDIGRESKKNSKGRDIVVHTIEVSGVQPRLSGWSFQGKIEQMEGGGSLVHSMNDSIPQKFWDCKPECEHCKTKRNRNQTFILNNIETNDYKQVGGSCLKDFFNNDDPQSAASYLEVLIMMDVRLSDLDEEGFSQGGTPAYLPIGLVLTLASAAVRQDGFISSARGEELMVMSTGQFVEYNLLGNPSVKDTIQRLPCDLEKASDIEQWLLSEAFDEKSASNAYFHNLRAIALLGAVPAKRIALMASSVSAYDRSKEEVAIKAVAEKSVFVGSVNEKLADLEVTKKYERAIPDNWGGKTLYGFDDKDGNALIWYCSGRGIGIQDNEIVHLSGTVKEHKDYRGVNQTIVTRVKITEAELYEHIWHHAHLDAFDLSDNKPAQKLMKRPFNVNVHFTEDSMTLLHFAAIYNPSYIKPLLVLGANPCAQDNSGNTAAHRAVWTNNEESVRLLQELAPDSFDAPNLQGETAASLMQEEAGLSLT